MGVPSNTCLNITGEKKKSSDNTTFLIVTKFPVLNYGKWLSRKVEIN